MHQQNTDVFLSEEDLDLQNLTEEELEAVCEAWLIAASATDQDDEHLYSHGVFLVEPGYQHLTPQFAHIFNPQPEPAILLDNETRFLHAS